MQGGETLGSNLDVWGDIRSSVGVMKALKARFDPAGILNPGRFVGGL
jgi:glycolate oxidase FAD binding subunit